jgi:hypothetical protein
MRSLGSSLTIAAIALAAPAFAGCAITNNSDGSTTIESLTKYTGTPETANPVAYSSGQGIHIIGVNGNITVSSGSGNQVTATFSPFTMDKGDATGESQAKDEMNNQIKYALNPGGEILVQVTRTGSNSYLGADVQVTIPSSFNGAFTVDQGNGDVDASLGGGATSVTVTNTNAGNITVDGAAGKLAISGAFDVSVGVSAWAPAGQDGSIHAGDLGNLSVSFPASATGTFTAQAGGQINDAGLPSNWPSASSAANSKSYTMGSGAGAKVDLVAGKDITIASH